MFQILSIIVIRGKVLQPIHNIMEMTTHHFQIVWSLTGWVGNGDGRIRERNIRFMEQLKVGFIKTR